MFRKQSGFLGVLFLQAVERLADSPTYLQTLKRIADSGVLVGDQVIEVFEAHGLHVEPGVFKR